MITLLCFPSLIACRGNSFISWVFYCLIFFVGRGSLGKGERTVSILFKDVYKCFHVIGFVPSPLHGYIGT